MATPSIPSTGRSLLLDRSTDILSLLKLPVPTPKPNSDQLLIRVHATALCADELRWHKFADIPGKEAKLIPGYDVAGTIVSSPSSSSPFKVGDEVYARTNYMRAGCARDYSIVETSEIALKPKNLGWQEAATISLSALTAWEALFEEAGFTEPGPNAKAANEGRRVLLTAASGSVGQWVLQLAREAGIHVIASCGTQSEDFVRELGAAEVVDYKKLKLTDWAAEDPSRKVDVIIDCYGGAIMQDAWGCIKDGGKIVSIVEPPTKPATCTANGVNSYFWIMHPDGKQLAKVTKLIEEGKCRGFLDSVYELEDYEKAFERLESRKAKGKVVLKLTD